QGVCGKMADMLGLIKREILQPKNKILKKLVTFVPLEQAEKVRSAIFAAGGGQIGNYSECSFNAEGEGTFRGAEGTHPFVGKIGERHIEKEVKMEVIFPAWIENRVV